MKRPDTEKIKNSKLGLYQNVGRLIRWIEQLEAERDNLKQCCTEAHVEWNVTQRLLEKAEETIEKLTALGLVEYGPRQMWEAGHLDDN